MAGEHGCAPAGGGRVPQGIRPEDAGRAQPTPPPGQHPPTPAGREH